MTAAPSLPSIGVITRTGTDQNEGRLPALDGARGLAIAAVFLYHATFDARAGWLYASFSWGWMGVDLFFTLSGYLITSILLDAVGQPPRFYYGSFYARRLLRLAPALCLFLVALFYVAPWTGLVRQTEIVVLRTNQGWYWAYLINVVVAKASSFDVTPIGSGSLWTLAVEEQFYLLWPFLVARAGTANRVRSLAVAVIVLAMCTRAFAWWRGYNPVTTYVLTISRADPLAWGALLASHMRLRQGEQGVDRFPLRLLLLGGVLLTFTALVQRNPDWPSWVGRPMQLVGFPALAMLSTALVSFTVNTKSGMLTWGPLARLGRYSYGLYLWHATALVLLKRTLDLRGVPFVLVGAMVCAVFTAASWVAVERPALRLKRFFPMAAPGAATPDFQSRPEIRAA